MRKMVILFFVVLLSMVSGQDVFTQQSLFFNGSPTFINTGQLGLFNPAGVQMIQYPEVRISYGRLNAESKDNYHLGYAFGMRGVSLNVFQHKIGNQKVTDYQLAFGDGNETFAWGTAFGWAAGDRGFFHRRSYWGAGFIFRPNPMLSISGAAFKPNHDGKWTGLAEVGFRPFKTEKLTVVANYMKNDLSPQWDERWGIGASAELFEGLKINGMYFDDKSIRFGINFSILGMMGIQSHHGRTEDGYQYGTYEIRFGGGEKSALFERIQKDKHIVKMHLKGKLDYQKFVLFDDQTIRFRDVLERIDAISHSPQIKVLAINLSGFQASSALIWELREALLRVKKAGKKVVIYVDNPSLGTYYLASSADLLVMDPLGILVMEGLLFSKTYVKGSLEKLGIGVDEWRFFKYKSAYETLSRKSMSEADSMQLQEYLNDIYARYRDDIAKSRGFSTDHFDKLVNEGVLFLAEDALEAGLIDTTGRWVDIDKIISDKWGKKYMPLPVKLVERYAEIDETWSEEPKIAIVYALGPCALDEGIRARFLEKVFAQLQKDKSVKAIVFRVDSPGGDALASDLVTEAIKKVKKEKPVIVSQGFVAGSGGYWISMAGNKILATPFTITGSIGVIGGWLYDQGFTGKLGLTADKVQVGKHADIGFGPTLPFLNMTVPYRNLTQEERGKIKDMFMRMYGQFVKKVAVNRGLEENHVRKIGEGHIYSGTDGREIGLVDAIGDLHSAIEEAKKMAGISVDSPVDIVEIPKYKGLFKMPSPMGVNGASEMNAAAKYYIKHLSSRPLVPIPMTPIAFWTAGF